MLAAIVLGTSACASNAVKQQPATALNAAPSTSGTLVASAAAVPAPPSTTALGALLGHITGDALADDYQPMNINFGLFAPLDEKVHKKSRKAAMTGRARTDLNSWISQQKVAA